MKYVVVFEETGNGWSAYVPDLPGCVAAAPTREDTERLIREVINLHISSLEADNEPIPASQTWTKTVEV